MWSIQWPISGSRSDRESSKNQKQQHLQLLLVKQGLRLRCLTVSYFLWEDNTQNTESHNCRTRELKNQAQNGWGCQEPLNTTQPNFPANPGLPGADCTARRLHKLSGYSVPLLWHRPGKAFPHTQISQTDKKLKLPFKSQKIPPVPTETQLQNQSHPSVRGDTPDSLTLIFGINPAATISQTQ